MTDLLPCPFCGSNEIARQSAMGEYWILCETCHATSVMSHYEQGADEAWNRRPAPPAKSEVSEAELRAFAKQVADNDRDQYHMSEGYAACIIAGPLRDFLEKRSSPGAQSGGSV